MVDNYGSPRKYLILGQEGLTHDPRLTDIQATASGAFAWYLATWLTQPLETVRMHVQIGSVIGELGAVQAGLTLMNFDSSTLTRGNWIAWMKTFPEFVIKSLALNSLKTKPPGYGVPREPTVGGMFLRVLASTISARLVTYPFEVCKLRAMQYTGPKPYTGLFDTGRRILLEEGILGLWKGLEIGIYANIVYSVSMSIIAPYTHAFATSWGIPPEFSMHAARLIAMFFAYPFETVKRRIAAECEWVPAHSLPGQNPGQLPEKLANTLWKENPLKLWAGFPLQAASVIAKSLIVRITHLATSNVFMWNNGYTVSIFDSTPLPGVPQTLSPNELLAKQRQDARV